MRAMHNNDDDDDECKWHVNVCGVNCDIWQPLFQMDKMNGVSIQVRRVSAIWWLCIWWKYSHACLARPTRRDATSVLCVHRKIFINGEQWIFHSIYRLNCRPALYACGISWVLCCVEFIHEYKDSKWIGGVVLFFLSKIYLEDIRGQLRNIIRNKYII